MPEEALSMRKIREVLRLSALGLAQHQIARSCSIVQSTVHKYLKLAQAAQLPWPLPDDLSDKKLDELLFGQRSEPPSRRVHPLPDIAVTAPCLLHFGSWPKRVSKHRPRRPLGEKPVQRAGHNRVHPPVF